MRKSILSLFFTLCGLLLFTAATFAAEPKLTLYVLFDGSINAKIAIGNPTGVFSKDQNPQFADGISGQGLITGGSNQHVVFDAAGNISPAQWTISFWMTGLPGAKWNGSKYLQTFWELNGSDGFMWFYEYSGQDQPWLLSRQGKEDTKTYYVPKAPEEQWHNWVMTWRKGSDVYVYLDGQAVGQSPCQPPAQIKNIAIGQRENPSEQNKIIDEFKIYDTALDAGSIARHYWQEGNFVMQPQITVAPTQNKITIDGKITPEEWSRTAGFTGLIDSQSWEIEAPQTWGKITYDNHNLYLAMHSDNPPEVKDHPDTTALYGFVKKDIVQHDGDVKSDDSFNFQLIPKNDNGNIFSIFINGIDTIYDAVSGASGKEDVSWQSNAQAKSIVGADGWSMEAAIPLQSLGLDQVAEGSSWRVNFGRIWKMLRQRTDEWAPGQRVDNQTLMQISGFGTVNFVSEPDAVVDLHQFGIAQDGEVNALLNIYNPGTAAHELTVTLNASDKILQTQKVLLQPGGQQAVTMKAIPQINGALIGITVQSGTKVLLHQSAPFIQERVGQLALWNYPSRQQIRLGWVIQNASDPNALNLNAQLKDGDGKILQNISVTHLPSLTGSQLVDVKSLPPEKYTLDAKVTSGQNVLQQQILAYDKEPLPSWLGNKLGISDTPPPPWTDVKVDKSKDAISIWGRDYDYAGNLLPTQIINQGKPMLAAPMQLLAKFGNTSQSSNTAKANTQWTKTTARRGESLRSQTLGKVNLKADSYTDFDGMTWMDLTVTPQSTKVLLDGLTLEIPLKAEWAELIKPYTDYTMQQTGALPKDGWKGDAMSMPWIGNGDGGIQFFQETTATWIGSKTIEIVPNGNDTVVMRVHLIDAPATLDKPLHFAFGWMASPVKPAPKNHRDWRLLNSPTFYPTYVKEAKTQNPNIQWYLPWWQGWWWLPEKNFKGSYDLTGPVPVPAGDGNKMENAVRDYYGQTFYAAPYGRLSEMGTDNPWFAQFGDEWVPNTNKFVQDTSVTPAYRTSTVSQASPSLRDFFAWGYDRLLNEGDVHALYFDVSRAIDDSNIYHGSGTQMPDGSIAPFKSILGMRQMFERIYTLMKAKHPDGKIFYHMSGEIMLPMDSFCDAMIDGENYAGKLDRKDNRGYEKVLSVDQFRAEYSAQNNFGPASVFLPEFGRTKSMLPEDWKTMGYGHADYLMGLVFLHDSNLWWSWMPEDYLSQVHTAMDSSGWNADWKFIPYWHQKYFSLPDGVYASLYQAPDDRKVLLVIMNTSDKDQDINLSMTLDKSTFKTARAVYPNQAITAQSGKTGAIHIANNDFCAVLLEK